MEPVFEERLSDRQLGLSLAGVGALPAVEADDRTRVQTRLCSRSVTHCRSPWDDD